MSLPLGTLGRPLPGLVLDRHVGAVLHQCLWRNRTETETSVASKHSKKFQDMMFKFPQASVTHLYAGEVSVLSGNVHGGVALLVNFVQRDGLFLHELK